jgi:hypothetical protein
MKANIGRRDFLKAASLAGAAGIVAATHSPSPGAETKMDAIREEPREVPVVADCDVCIVGGSCTGVLAAVAAARLGAKVALVELSGFFGGVATASLVNICHSTTIANCQLPIAQRTLHSPLGTWHLALAPWPPAGGRRSTRSPIRPWCHGERRTS